MKVLYGPEFNIAENTAVTIGKFDGLHIGHKKVIEELKNVSKKNNLKSVIYTFNQNPRLVLNQAKFTPLMTNEEKTKKIEEENIDYLVYEDFNESFSTLTPKEFVEDVLVKKLNVKIVVMGENSTFGKDRSGNIDTMRSLGEKYNFLVVCVNLILNNGEIVSSTGIREYKFLEKC